MSCPHATDCPLYSQFSLDSLLKYWKSSYCEADHGRCARYKLSLAGQPVPLNLLPSGKLMAAAAVPKKTGTGGG